MEEIKRGGPNLKGMNKRGIKTKEQKKEEREKKTASPLKEES
jgi:hypothetical protein